MRSGHHRPQHGRHRGVLGLPHRGVAGEPRNQEKLGRNGSVDGHCIDGGRGGGVRHRHGQRIAARHALQPRPRLHQVVHKAQLDLGARRHRKRIRIALPQTAVEAVKQNSRRYSKRQITWFKNRMAVDFQDILAPDFKEQVERKIERFLDDKN